MKAATAKGKVIACPVEFQSTPPVKAATRHNVAQRVIRPISIHAAREGGDGFGFCPCRRAERFQSTPPVKAATENGIEVAAKIKISIHAAREGGDFQFFAFAPRRDQFQSTPPVKAATKKGGKK